MQTEGKQEVGGVLTGECLLVAFSHGYEVPQAGVKLLHDGLKEKKEHVGQLSSRNDSDTNTDMSHSDRAALFTGA